MVHGVLDKGNIFTGNDFVSLDHDQNIGVGAWMSELFGNGTSGNMKCNNEMTGGGYLLDLVAYLLKNYTAGVSANDLLNANAHVTQQDRLNIVCNKNDTSKPGLLQPATTNLIGLFEASSEACDAPTVQYYTGVNSEQQNAYFKSLYEEMQRNSNNKYIQSISWDDIGNYNGVDGYYLYSNDFEKQCNANFSKTGQGKSGYRISNNGIIESGYYSVSNDTARQSFVNQKLTCTGLIDEMNEHIKEYVQFVNYETFTRCMTEIHSEINNKTDEINAKYINSETATEAEIEDAKAVLKEYTRIMQENEYVSSIDENNEETLQRFSGMISQNNMPETYIYTCRSHLPFINVEVKTEADLKQSIEDEFMDYCYKALGVISWFACPAINNLSEAVDGLTNMINEFF